MKLNIQKLQTGGGMFFSAAPNLSSPYAGSANTDDNTTSTKSSKSSTSSSGDDGLLSKTVMSKLMENGIPNDVRKLFNMISHFESQSNFGFGINKNQIYEIQAYANQVIQQSDYLKNAETEAYKNGAIDEIAVDNRGYVYVPTENGTVNKVALKDFDPETQVALTVGELLQERRNNDSLTDRSDIVNTIANSVGMEKITDYIQDIISKIGHSETTQDAYEDLATLLGAGVKKPNQSVLEAIKGISGEIDKIGLNAIFKITETNKSDNINEAMKYILSVLPNNMRTQLQAQYVANFGQNYNNANDYAISIIQNALLSSNKTVQKTNIDYQEGLNTQAGITKNSNKDQTRNQTVLEMFFNQNLNRTKVNITDPKYNNGYELTAYGSVIPALSTDAGNAMGSMPLNYALDAKGNGMSKYLDFNQVYLGYDHVNAAKLSDVVYNGDQVANVWLPVNAYGDIDWELFENYQSAEEEIKQNNITSPEEKNKIHRKYLSSVQYNADGSITESNRVAQFLMTHGYTVDDNLSATNSLYKSFSRTEQKDLDTLIQQINKTYKTNINSKGLFDDVLEIPIFIKIQPNAAINSAYYAHQGSLVPKTTIQQDMEQQLIQQAPTVQINANAMMLNQE